MNDAGFGMALRGRDLPLFGGSGHEHGASLGAQFTVLLERMGDRARASHHLHAIDRVSIDISGGRELRFVSPEYHEDPAETRRSVEHLLALPFAVLCLDHGAPVTDEPKAALKKLLAAGNA